MKKLMTLMLGLSFLMGTVSLFAQDKPADINDQEGEEGQKGEESRSPPTPTRRANFSFIR